MGWTRFWTLLLIFLIGYFSEPRAVAQPDGLTRPGERCSANPLVEAAPSLSNLDVATRLRWLELQLAKRARRAEWWRLGWSGPIGLSGIASFAALPFAAPADHVDWYVSAGSAAVGVLQFALAPPRIIEDSHRLRVRLAQPAQGDGCALLHDVEELLVLNAKEQRSHGKWWAHAGNVAFNTSVLLLLGLGFGHWESGIIQGAAGIAVGEAILFTQPSGSIDDLQDYRRLGER